MNKLTDENIDTVLKAVASQASLDEASVNEIASSPQLWWAIQRDIANGKEAAASPWPPVERLRRWFAFAAVPTLAAILIAVGFVFLRGGGAEQIATSSGSGVIATPSDVTVGSVGDTAIEKTIPHVVPVKAAKMPSKPLKASREQMQKDRAEQAKTVRKSDEIKSEFIALSYSRSPESGQIVRVRVPSSMMVNLGLVDSVQKPTSLVDAEVVVGDDGQTHAIRFIRQ